MNLKKLTFIRLKRFWHDCSNFDVTIATQRLYIMHQILNRYNIE